MQRNNQFNMVDAILRLIKFTMKFILIINFILSNIVSCTTRVLSYSLFFRTMIYLG